MVYTNISQIQRYLIYPNIPYIEYRILCMEYTGWCQSDFNVRGCSCRRRSTSALSPAASMTLTRFSEAGHRRRRRHCARSVHLFKDAWLCRPARFCYAHTRARDCGGSLALAGQWVIASASAAPRRAVEAGPSCSEIMTS
jgi:hypothetical protein